MHLIIEVDAITLALLSGGLGRGWRGALLRGAGLDCAFMGLLGDATARAAAVQREMRVALTA